MMPLAAEWSSVSGSALPARITAAVPSAARIAGDPVSQ
ncbi:Uncharacterised protein [Mycobacteroides abscessus subsp. abscessus]|nr:Uncharacterised protein [Mycobacteroides abscessus subsp. abscessus]